MTALLVCIAGKEPLIVNANSQGFQIQQTRIFVNHMNESKEDLLYGHDSESKDADDDAFLQDNPVNGLDTKDYNLEDIDKLDVNNDDDEDNIENIDDYKDDFLEPSKDSDIDQQDDGKLEDSGVDNDDDANDNDEYDNDDDDDINPDDDKIPDDTDENKQPDWDYNKQIDGDEVKADTNTEVKELSETEKYENIEKENSNQQDEDISYNKINDDNLENVEKQEVNINNENNEISETEKIADGVKKAVTSVENAVKSLDDAVDNVARELDANNNIEMDDKVIPKEREEIDGVNDDDNYDEMKEYLKVKSSDESLEANRKDIVDKVATNSKKDMNLNEEIHKMAEEDAKLIAQQILQVRKATDEQNEKIPNDVGPVPAPSGGDNTYRYIDVNNVNNVKVNDDLNVDRGPRRDKNDVGAEIFMEIKNINVNEKENELDNTNTDEDGAEINNLNVNKDAREINDLILNKDGKEMKDLTVNEGGSEMNDVNIKDQMQGYINQA